MHPDLPPTRKHGCQAGCLLVFLASVALWAGGAVVFHGLDAILRGLIHLHRSAP